MDRRSFLGLMALGGLGATAPGEVGPKMTNSVPLHERASGTPATGTVTLSFPPCRTGRIWLGAITIPSALPTDTWNLTIGGQLAAVVVGSGPFGPVQVQSGQVLSLAGTVGLTTPYQAVLSGIDDPSSDPTSYTGPIALPGAGTVTFPQTLIGTFTALQTSGTVNLPPNCESIVVVGLGIGWLNFSSCIGTTTGVTYPASWMNGDSLAISTFVVVSVSPALDPAVTITLTAAPAGGWKVVADAAIRQVIDLATSLAIGIELVAAPLGRVIVAGTTAAGIVRAIRMSLTSEQYVIATAPGTGTGDHPPTELQIVSAHGVGAGGTILVAPGAGLRYRVFFIQMVQYFGTGNGYVIAGTLVLGWNGSTPGGAFVDLKPTGIPCPANTALTWTIVGAGTITFTGVVVYTVESST
jgi:hypothetical protein